MITALPRWLASSRLNFEQQNLTAATAASGLQLEREGTPEPPGEEAGADDGQTAEMRRLLRAPRYFDDDFEAVCFLCVVKWCPLEGLREGPLLHGCAKDASGRLR